MERLNKVCTDASVDMMRVAAPMTARWALHNTLPKLAAKAVDASFLPLLVALATTARLAVLNRKRVIGA